MFRSFAEPVARWAEPPDPRRIRTRGRRRRRNLLGGAMLAAVALIVGAVGVRAGLLADSTPSVGQVASPTTLAAPGPATTASAPSSTPPSTTLPLGKVTSLDAVQVTGPGSVVVVGKRAILATTDSGRTWVRVWEGPGDLRDVNFSSASAGWALGDGLVLATADGGLHWGPLGEPAQGTLRRVHFVSRTEGWGVAGGADQAVEGPMVPTGATRLVHSVDGGRTWSAQAAPAPPQSVCFTSPADGWLASGTRVWRSTDGGRSWGRKPSFTLPVDAGSPPFQAELQCAEPAAAWVRFDGGGAAAGHSPYALYTTRDGGGRWRGVLAEANTLSPRLRLPSGPGSTPGPFSVIDPTSAFLLSPTPAANAVGGVLVEGEKFSVVSDIRGSFLSDSTSVSFASRTTGWAVGKDGAGRAVILVTSDGGRRWSRQLRF